MYYVKYKDKYIKYKHQLGYDIISVVDDISNASASRNRIRSSCIIDLAKEQLSEQDDVFEIIEI